MAYYICFRCMKKFEDSREEEFACPFCHCAVLPYEGPTPAIVSHNPLLLLRANRLYRNHSKLYEAMNGPGGRDLIACRAELGNLLDKAFAEPKQVSENWPHLERTIVKWFMAYKEWESKDTFQCAFAESRMTLRWLKTNHPLKMIYNRVEASEGLMGPTKHWPFQQTIGFYWLPLRAQPENFDPVSRKLQLGLHDLSGCLLDPRHPLSSQTFNHPAVGDKYAFMPLSDPGDQLVCYRLRSLTIHPQFHQKALHQLVRHIRARMTRIRLARDYDIGTHLVAYEPDNPSDPRFKYEPVASLKQRAVNQQAQPEVPLTPELHAHLKTNALHFKSILAGNSEAAAAPAVRPPVGPRQGNGPPPPPASKPVINKNEITVAYREHASGLFPIITKWNGRQFAVCTITDDGAALLPTTHSISDRGAYT
ncbi:hypothetical protein [Corallococcus terminator]|nr:hypothetical protein [Corallococcus terminator]